MSVLFPDSASRLEQSPDWSLSPPDPSGLPMPPLPLLVKESAVGESSGWSLFSILLLVPGLWRLLRLPHAVQFSYP